MTFSEVIVFTDNENILNLFFFHAIITIDNNDVNYCKLQIQSLLSLRSLTQCRTICLNTTLFSIFLPLYRISYKVFKEF
jgi:hypothetical protein